MQRQVQLKFESYPDAVRSKLAYLRSLILYVASNTNGVEDIKECI